MQNAVQYWLQTREQQRNWLALGVVLAAWNFTADSSERDTLRPPELRHYAQVTVRAAQRHAVLACSTRCSVPK